MMKRNERVVVVLMRGSCVCVFALGVGLSIAKYGFTITFAVIVGFVASFVATIFLAFRTAEAYNVRSKVVSAFRSTEK